MDGYPVIIRLIDPPLHEFLPKYDELSEELADLKVKLLQSQTLNQVDGLIAEINEKTALRRAVEGMREMNPMLGLRGCRLGILYPEITEMQARAIFEAACEVQREGIEVRPEIMIPLVGNVNELKQQAGVVRKAAKEVMDNFKEKIRYTVGTMIELPRAALTADEIATVAEFFSFGTNDLTQTTYGLSRDDAGKFLEYYYVNGILKDDPFQTVDQEGVGQLMKIGVEKGRSVKKDLKIGICGEHGGETKSVEFCDKLGLDYVSCSPFRVPIARLAAARATISAKRSKK